MQFKKVCGFALSCTLMLGCLSVTAGAAGTGADTEGLGNAVLTHFEVTDSIVLYSTRASGALDVTIPAGTTVSADESFPLESGETVTINCSYSPASASMDFGLLDSDGSFHYLNVTNGSINRSIRVSERGSYTLAIRNNSSSSVRVVGFVNY